MRAWTGALVPAASFAGPPTPPKQWRKDFLVPFLWDSYWCSRLHLETVAVHFGKTFTTLLLPTMDIGQYPLLPSIQDDFCFISLEKPPA